MRSLDWLVVLVCLIGSVCTGMIAYHKGLVAGRLEAERVFALQVLEMNRICDQSEIRKWLEAGR